MAQLVVYSDSSSEEDNDDFVSSFCRQSGPVSMKQKRSDFGRDLPITDESDDQCRDLYSTDTTRIVGSRENRLDKSEKAEQYEQKHDQSSETSQKDYRSSTNNQDKHTHTFSHNAHIIDNNTHTFGDSRPLNTPLQSDTLINHQSCDPKLTSKICKATDQARTYGLFSEESSSINNKPCDIVGTASIPGDEAHINGSDCQSKTQLNRKRKLNNDSNEQLPLPAAIHSMYHNSQHKWVDDPSLHNNRVRSFPHLEGNWATHVHIAVPQSDLFVGFVNNLLELLMPDTFQVHQDFHVSLSRTVVIRYHWIEALIDSLRENLKDLTSCLSDLTDVKLFTNDDNTRTFVTIELSQEDEEFMNYVRAVDKSFAEFKLPAYYENPSFHISVGWCLGDKRDKISDTKLSDAQQMLGEFVAAYPSLGYVYANEICCKSGCKSFVIALKDFNK